MQFLLTSLFVASLARLGSTGIARERSSDTHTDTYDYIIVGGGTAGVALATRLSHGLPHSSILLVEAGPYAPDELGINVPGKKSSTFGTQYDWNFTTVPQEHLNGRVIPWTRGHVLGGSSALNLLCFDRAAAAEYDAWEELGSTGWNWETLLPAMERSMNFTGLNTPTYGSIGMGTHGPLHAVVDRYMPPQADGFIPAGVSLGLPTNRESLGGNPIGVMFQPSSIDPTHYNRSYSANSYLPLAAKNLEIWTNTKVSKINFDKQGRHQKAIGVTLDNGTLIAAQHEVILSAGTIQSPGLLELSGIGQASVLAAAGIPQLIDLLGVGENLQDHLRSQVGFQLKDNYTSFDILRYNATYAAEELNKWLAGEFSRYDFSSSGFIFADWKHVLPDGDDSSLVSLARAALANSTNPVDKKKLSYLSDPRIPQIEIIFGDGYSGAKGYPAAGTPLYGKGFSTLIVGLMHPLSRGSIHVNASDPRGKPVISPNYLNNEYDAQSMIALLKFARRLAEAEPLAVAWAAEYEPGAGVQTDAQWREYVLNSTSTIYHPTSTCAMLPRKDGGVVDANLKVYGTSNLRVVDASVFPIQLSAHIQTAVYGIAERAAEFIIADAHR